MDVFPPNLIDPSSLCDLAWAFSSSWLIIAVPFLTVAELSIPMLTGMGGNMPTKDPRISHLVELFRKLLKVHHSLVPHSVRSFLV